MEAILKMKLYKVHSIRGEDTHDGIWVWFEGIFDSVAAAEAICVDERFCITECELNVHIQDGSPLLLSWWPKAEYCNTREDAFKYTGPWPESCREKLI